MTARLPIVLSLTATPSDLLSASQTLSHRHIGRGRLVFLIMLVFPAGLAGGTLMAWLIGLPLADAGLVSLYAVLAAQLAFFFLQFRIARRYRSAFSGSALRNAPCRVQLDNSGLAIERGQISWSGITGTGRWKDATLIHFSAVDALVVPDRDLPEGLTPDQFASAVNALRTGAMT